LTYKKRNCRIVSTSISELAAINVEVYVLDFVIVILSDVICTVLPANVSRHIVASRWCVVITVLCVLSFVMQEFTARSLHLEDMFLSVWLLNSDNSVIHYLHHLACICEISWKIVVDTAVMV